MLRLLLPTPVDGVPMCLGALVALYLCLVVVVVVAARPRETFRFGDGMPAVSTPNIDTPDIDTPDIGTPDIGTPDIDTPDISTPDIGTPDIDKPSLPDSNNVLVKKQTVARPRMIRSLQATVTDGKDAHLKLDDAAFAPSANWMQEEAQYLMREVLPVHKRLMRTKTLYDGESDTVSRKHRCPKVSSTDALMGNQSVAMYQCAETALLRVLPALNKPVTMDSSTPTDASSSVEEEETGPVGGVWSYGLTPS